MNRAIIEDAYRKAVMTAVANGDYNVTAPEEIMSTIEKKHMGRELTAQDTDMLISEIGQKISQQKHRLPKIPGVDQIKFWK